MIIFVYRHFVGTDWGSVDMLSVILAQCLPRIDTFTTLLADL
jgi:hypothetical protein